MSNEEISASKKNPKFSASSSLLRKEREKRGWSQNELAERIGTNQISISRWENGTVTPTPYYRQKLASLFGKSLEELGLVTALENEESRDANTASLSSASPRSEPYLPLWNVPYRRNPFFTGREDILTTLYTILVENKSAALTQTQAISGLGGIGKTQVAVEYAYRYATHYRAVLWVTASSRNTLTTDFVMLASLLNLSEQHEQDQSIVIRAVKRWLVTHDRWLLVLDNVDDLETLADFLPIEEGRGSFLLTTRLQALGSIAHNIEVEKMGQDEGVKFLLQRTKVDISHEFLDIQQQDTKRQTEEIVSLLDGLPLALDQAGAYIEEIQCSFSAYLNLYHTHRKDLLLRRGRLPVNHPEPVATTWSLSFRQIEQESLAAADLLRLLVFLGSEAIPEEVISKGAADLGPVLCSVASDPLQLNAAIGLLLRYSLLRRDPNTEFLSIHRLVQAVLKDDMEKAQQCLWAERAIRALNMAFPDVELNTWTQCQRCLPHAQVCSEHIKQYRLAFSEAARLLNQAANYLSTHAEYGQAELLLQQALEIREQGLPAHHPDTASILNDLGMLYLTQGKYPQSEPRLEQARTIRQEVLGGEHPDTATSLNNLALLYYAQGKYIEAKKLYHQALEIRQRVLDPEHPAIAQSRSNLAELYTLQGKFAEAEELYMQARDSQQRVLGLNHPDVARTLNKLALLYRSKGEYSKAEQYYEQALNIQKKVLGEKHPDVAETIYNKARLYRAQGKYIEAEPIYQQALAIREEVFGPKHPHVALSFYGLAKLYNSQWKYYKAQELAQRALKIQQQYLENEHPDVASTLGVLAKAYQGQGKLNEAEAFNRKALRIQEHTLDANHPRIALISNNLVEIYHAQERYLEAGALITRSISIHEQTLGSDHPYFAYSLSNRAENFFLRKEYTQAEAIFKQVLAIRERNLTSCHPRIATTCHYLATLYSSQGDYDKAEPFLERALSIREQVLGPEHPTVAISLEAYAILLHATGREEHAQEVEARVQKIKANSIESER